MSTELVVVDTDVVDLAARDVAARTEAMVRILERLEGDVERIMPLWTGLGAEAFAAARRSWAGAIDDMVEVLRLLRVATDRSARAYETAEANAQAYWA